MDRRSDMGVGTWPGTLKAGAERAFVGVGFPPDILPAGRPPPAPAVAAAAARAAIHAARSVRAKARIVSCLRPDAAACSAVGVKGPRGRGCGGRQKCPALSE